MEVHLHLGAHRTGSTRLQREMERRAAFVARRGIAVATPATLRPRREGPRWPLGPSLGARFAERFRAAMAAAEAAGAPRLIASDEEYLGAMDRILARGTLYPHPGRRLRRVAAELGPRSEVTLFLAIRSYGPFFASLYAHRVQKRPLPAFDVHRARFLRLRRRWPDVVGDIARLFPGRPIRVWRFEDSVGQGAQMLRHLFGAAELAALNEARQVSRSPSAVAVAALNGMEGTEAERAALARALSGPEAAPFQPWGAEDRAHLSALYRADCAAIAAMPGVTLLDLSQNPTTHAPRLIR